MRRRWAFRWSNERLLAAPLGQFPLSGRRISRGSRSAGVFLVERRVADDFADLRHLQAGLDAAGRANEVFPRRLLVVVEPFPFDASAAK